MRRGINWGTWLSLVVTSAILVVGSGVLWRIWEARRTPNVACRIIQPESLTWGIWGVYGAVVSVSNSGHAAATNLRINVRSTSRIHQLDVSSSERYELIWSEPDSMGVIVEQERLAPGVTTDVFLTTVDEGELKCEIPYDQGRAESSKGTDSAGDRDELSRAMSFFFRMTLLWMIGALVSFWSGYLAVYLRERRRAPEEAEASNQS